MEKEAYDPTVRAEQELKMRKIIILAVVCLLLVGAVCAQDAVPTEIMQRTFLIKNDAANTYGTAFLVDHKGIAYLVTARHMVEGLPVTKATIGVWQDNTWKSMQTVKTLFPKSDEADIAVLKLDQKVSTPFSIQPQDDTSGPTMDSPCGFSDTPSSLVLHSDPALTGTGVLLLSSVARCLPSMAVIRMRLSITLMVSTIPVSLGDRFYIGHSASTLIRF
jgi:hypothetical protein